MSKFLHRSVGIGVAPSAGSLFGLILLNKFFTKDRIRGSVKSFEKKSGLIMNGTIFCLRYLRVNHPDDARGDSVSEVKLRSTYIITRELVAR